MKKIAIIGECMIELSGDSVDTLTLKYGGDTLNTATYLSRITSSTILDVHYISSIGVDPLSEHMIKCWQSDGINTDWVLRDVQHLPGLYFIQLNNEGERSFLYWRDNSAAKYLLQHNYYSNILKNLEQVDMIYLSGISLAILPENDRSLLISQLSVLAKKGVQIIFDSNYRPSLWKDPSLAKKSYEKILSFVHIALVTHDDEQLLWEDNDEQETLHRLNKMGVEIIVIKLGKNGALCSQKGETQRIKTLPIKHVIDTTAAGDSFNAGFLNGYIQGKSIFDCCSQGNAVAGVVIQHKGAIIPLAALEDLKNKFN